MSKIRLILFAKAPIPGYAKTRLIPALGAQGAARFHQVLVQDSLQTLCRVNAAVELHYSEPHPFFWRMTRLFNCRLQPQTKGDLGQRMLAALRQQQGPAMIMGSDCPSIATAMVERCISTLKTADMVILPAEDGGYGLIGCKQPHHPEQRHLFEGIPWGTSEVLKGTRQAAKVAGLSLRELDTIWDIDTPEDLLRWQRTSEAPQ